MTNINFTILDESKEQKCVSYKEILEEVELFLIIKEDTKNDPYINLVVEYNNNYNLKQLKQIAEYYELNVNKNKGDLINNIIEFEKNKNNSIKVCKRKKLWAYMKELKEDQILSKYLQI